MNLRPPGPQPGPSPARGLSPNAVHCRFPRHIALFLCPNRPLPVGRCRSGSPRLQSTLQSLPRLLPSANAPMPTDGDRLHFMDDMDAPALGVEGWVGDGTASADARESASPAYRSGPPNAYLLRSAEGSSVPSAGTNSTPPGPKQGAPAAASCRRLSFFASFQGFSDLTRLLHAGHCRPLPLKLPYKLPYSTRSAATSACATRSG